MIPLDRSGALQERGSGNPSAPDPTNDPRGDARYAWADGDVALVQVDARALLENLIDALAEDETLRWSFTRAIVLSQPVGLTPSAGSIGAAIVASRADRRVDELDFLGAHPDIEAALTHVLTEDQATDLALELDHAIRQIAVAGYDPHAIERADLEDQWTEPVP